MICYRDMTFCSDKPICDTTDSECGRRFTDEDKRKAIQMDMPVAYGSFKETCGKFKEQTK